MAREKILITILWILLLGNMFGCAVGIHDAAKKGKVDIVNSLLAEKPERISAKDKKDNTPLHIAAFHGHKDVAELLIAKGADVNAKDKEGWTPLHEAALYDHTAVSELLRRHGGK